jgi:hypothetical protein
MAVAASRRTLFRGVAAVLVTVTSTLRIHRDEVICALVRGNTVHLRFVAMKPMRIPIDDLTEEARFWLLPSLAPREIPVGDEGEPPGHDGHDGEGAGDEAERADETH